MEVIYKFDFKEGSDDLHELAMVQNATDMYCALSEIQDKCRSWYKYDQRTEIPTEEIRDEIYDIIRDHVDLEKL